eukprot:3361010-Rhodomonas_salina.6
MEVNPLDFTPVMSRAHYHVTAMSLVLPEHVTSMSILVPGLATRPLISQRGPPFSPLPRIPYA